MATENHKGNGGCGHGGRGNDAVPLKQANCSCGCSDASHPHTPARGYDSPLIDSGDDCGCEHHPEDEAAKEIAARMFSQLDEVIALSSGYVYGAFMADEALQTRLMDLLDKVQEGALLLPSDYKRRKTKADWEFLQTLNGQIVHSELGMNPETLWDIVRLELPYQHKMLGIIINGCSHEH
ncbi:MAG: hypothetical protein LBU81_02005 [Methanosarcinales archaeon]|jgi:uncharacterized protein with HEPN domain|nr:hypothetical protein [Methanosarcinales archaeon]